MDNLCQYLTEWVKFVVVVVVLETQMLFSPHILAVHLLHPAGQHNSHTLHIHTRFSDKYSLDIHDCQSYVTFFPGLGEKKSNIFFSTLMIYKHKLFGFMT